MAAATLTTFRCLPPALAEAVGRLGIHVRRPVRGRGEGLHRSPDYGASVEFAEYRDYTPGDPPNRIDWAVYARTDRYRVRRFQEETSLRGVIVLDVSASMDFCETGPMSKWAYACRLAAGVIYALVRQGDSAALYAAGASATSACEPVGHLGGLAPALRWLDTTQPTGAGRLADSIVSASAQIRERSLVVVISDFLEAREGLTRAFRRLYHEGHSLIALHVADGGERAPVFSGPVELEDSETRQRLVVEIDEIRARYEQAFLAHSDGLRRACADCLGDYHLIDTREAAELALRRMAAGGR